MRTRLIRVLLSMEFLIAVQVLFTSWSEVGGQYHLDLMFWPWKLGLTLPAAAAIVAISAGRRVRLAVAVLVLTVAAAGVVTYYYHVNEPADEGQDYQDQQTGLRKIRSANHTSASRPPGSVRLAETSSRRRRRVAPRDVDQAAVWMITSPVVMPDPRHNF